jgi:hypothetical protein
LISLIKKVKDILKDYESPILNDVLVYSNYIITKFIIKKTPLMKVLTGIELIINKVKEWEIYASRTMNNSCED